MAKRIGKHLRGNVVGYIALFVALGMGTAYALDRNSVKSKHIAKSQVKASDINKRAEAAWIFVHNGQKDNGSPGVRVTRTPGETHTG